MTDQDPKRLAQDERAELAEFLGGLTAEQWVGPTLCDQWQPAGLTARFGGRIGLVDGLIHHQDIRRALGVPREIPRERLSAALPFATSAPPIRASPRITGLRLVATDVDWATGEGPTVEGPAEPLLMAIAGRGDAIDELTGSGQPTLASRVAG